MPRFLLIIIFVFVLAGYIFQVKDNSQVPPPSAPVDKSQEQMVVEKKVDTDGKSVEIIKWPLVSGDENEEKIPVPIDNGVECLFFDGDIPRLDKCPT